MRSCKDLNIALQTHVDGKRVSANYSYILRTISNLKGIIHILQYIIDKDLVLSFPNFSNSFRIFAKLAITDYSGEASFSTLNIKQKFLVDVYVSRKNVGSWKDMSSVISPLQCNIIYHILL